MTTTTEERTTRPYVTSYAPAERHPGLFRFEGTRACARSSGTGSANGCRASRSSR